MEVAEHLYQEYAPEFISLLTSLSNIVLFSAAIPLQGGTHHINEQPPAYWANLFEKKGYVCFDILRFKIWDNINIASYYRQNALIFVHKDYATFFTNQGFMPTPSPVHLVHPEVFAIYATPNKNAYIKRRIKCALIALITLIMGLLLGLGLS